MLTKNLSSKSNVKQFTNNDLPFATQQPVIASFYAVSTLAQTVINLTYSVDTTNSDVFFLFVDGKKLTLGSTSDYAFTAIAADKTSSQVTLNQSLAVNLNIQAYKMGLKKESEFQTDNRFTALYDAMDQGFQGFIGTQKTLSAIPTVGTPAAGTFYSTITNRASIVDMSQDLKPRMGVERIMTQSLIQLQNEFGPNGEPVLAVLNDTLGQIRLVGSWISGIDGYGTYLQTAVGTDYIEVTFYGTALNILSLLNNSTRTYTASIDGAAAVTLGYPATGSSLFNSRNYATNQVLNVVSGLALGIHTAKIAMTGSPYVYGFEILNESSLIKVTPGVAYLKGQKYTASSLQSFAYASSVTGVRGGRVLTYLNGDGTIGTAFQAVNAASATLTSADHTNEELVRTYNPREFGAGRSDDFSLMSSNGNYAFTLDDGTTTLIGSQMAISTISGVQALVVQINGSFATITFVGTGLDITQVDSANGGADTHTVSIDGAAAINLPSAGSTTVRNVKIVSGLPYGTHTVRFTRVTAATFGISIVAFKVYQPKKPSLPAGTIELADYNVMANFAVPSSATNASIANELTSSGVLRKFGLREVTYVGAGWTLSADTTALNFQRIQTTTAGDYVQYTFFGTGFDLRYYLAGNNATAATVTVDGSTNLSGFTSAFYGGISFTASTGVLNQSSTSGLGTGGLAISGLALGLHTVRITYTSGGAAMRADAFDIITPIHSTKSNTQADLQNTLPVGSQGISDNRKTSAIKDATSQIKRVWKAIGVANNTSASTVLVPCPDMSLTIQKVNPGFVEINFSGRWTNTTGTTFFILYVNGSQADTTNENATIAGSNIAAGASTTVYLPAGTHKIDLYWSNNTGTSVAVNNSRILTVKEI